MAELFLVSLVVQAGTRQLRMGDTDYAECGLRGGVLWIWLPGGRLYSGRRRRSHDERQRQPLLVLVLAPLVPVTHLAHRLPPEEQDLGNPLVGVNLGRQRRRVADLDRDLAAPLRLQGRNVHYYAA